jgi:hypothetical protein
VSDRWGAPGWGEDEASLPSADELFGPPGDPDAAIAQVRRDLGLPGAPRPPRRDGPDVHGLSEDLGLA